METNKCCHAYFVVFSALALKVSSMSRSLRCDRALWRRSAISTPAIKQTPLALTHVWLNRKFHQFQITSIQTDHRAKYARTRAFCISQSGSDIVVCANVFVLKMRITR